MPVNEWDVNTRYGQRFDSARLHQFPMKLWGWWVCCATLWLTIRF